MDKTMRAAVVRVFGKPLHIEELLVPTVRDHQVLIKVEACGVCHTDLHAANGDWPVKPNLPFVPGHEGVGRVIVVGPNVIDLRVGDRVGVPWLYSACGACEWCTSGWETLCPEAKYGGYTVNGSYAEYVVADARYAARIPDELTAIEAAPVLCAGVTTYKGLKETEARPGDWVAVLGAGGLGHMAIQYAIAMGLNVAVADIAEDKLDLARQLGAKLIVNSAEVDPVQAIEREIGGAHGVLVTAPSMTAIQQAVGMTRRKGTCVLVGLPPGNLPLPVFDVVLKRITVRGSLVGTRADIRDALALAATHRITAHCETFALDDINTVFDRMHAGALVGRAVLIPSGVAVALTIAA
jgi:propanol-preferring alcohol dehydrogenase